MGFADPCEYILTWDLPAIKKALLKKLYEMMEDYVKSMAKKKRQKKMYVMIPNGLRL